MSTPPTGLLGGTSIWPYADMRLHAGSIVWVAAGIKLGIVRVNGDGTVDGKLFGGSDETFWERYVTLAPSEPTSPPVPPRDEPPNTSRPIWLAT